MPAANTISLQLQDLHKEIIDHAAASCGKTSSDFIIESALEKAREMFSEKTHFVLTPKQWDEFVKILDHPPAINPGLHRLIRTVPPWEHQ